MYEAIKEFWRKYSKSRAGLLGLFLIVGFILMAIFADDIAPFHPMDTRSGEPFQLPS
ncbi:MAG: hypothetical protein JRH18_21680 [Deltaproteobacteria bacterium]|nr:hypothetical protein [Deltaproteobacteria bacterium]MBW2154263.1 hypothetical protein [Deltaproteobacteria bacterium]